MQPTLLVLAAGMGSRYGGLKQVDPVGPNGETLLDYSVYDALQAGFGKIVFVIRRDFEALFREQIGARYAGKADVAYVFQSLDALPPGFSIPAGREKPWGTGHATWCARDAITTPFAVINADDFYGRESFRLLAKWMSEAKPGTGAMAGFQLARTLSENGLVSRGVCHVGTSGKLLSVTEHTGIPASDVGEGKRLTGLETVSMNCWAFLPSIFRPLDGEFFKFLEEALLSNPTKAEFYLPTAISTLIQAGVLEVDVLKTQSDWFGVTYKEDKPRVVQAIASLVNAGAYPARLF